MTGGGRLEGKGRFEGGGGRLEGGGGSEDGGGIPEDPVKEEAELGILARGRGGSCLGPGEMTILLRGSEGGRGLPAGEDEGEEYCPGR